MEDLPTSMLLQQKSAKPRTGEELEAFGKYAAALYTSQRCNTLTESVVETVKSAGLSPEQVHRVVEFANTSAYLKKFANEGPHHKVINFSGGPASLPEVLRDLNDGGGGSVYDSGSHDYSMPPPDVAKMAMRNREAMGLEETKLAEAFSVQEVPIPFEEPLRDAIDMKDKLASLYNEATYELSGLESHYIDVCDELFQQVKQAAMAGTSLGHVVAAWHSVTDEPEFVKAAFALLTPRLLQNGVYRNAEGIGSSLEKYAGFGAVNGAHPLVGVFTDFCETLTKMAATRSVQDDIVEQLDVISTFLKKAADASAEAAEGVVGKIPKAWSAVRDWAAEASGPAAAATTKVLGPKAGKVVGGLVKYSPHIGVGIAGEEAYQRATNSPILRAPMNFVAERIPYTGANIQRQYRMQMGM